MTPFRIVLLVCFIMVMFLWLLGLLGAAENIVRYSPWLAWFACMCVGVAVYAPRDK